MEGFFSFYKSLKKITLEKENADNFKFLKRTLIFRQA
jgi:hypothetical protein